VCVFVVSYNSMGQLCSAAQKTRIQQQQEERERRINDMIQRKLHENHNNDKVVKKLLLLGAGESGKSTLFKQAIQLYGKKFGPSARMPYATFVYANIILSMKTLIRFAEKLHKQNPDDKTLYSDEVKASVDFMEKEVTMDSAINSTIASHIKALWEDPGIKETFNQRHRFQLSDACAFYFDEIDEIAKEDYLPSYEDVLRVRVRTLGIVETAFPIEGTSFKLLDVGGQRSERKKWFQCFSGVTAVIFVSAINEYDQVLWEDNKTNRLQESLRLFKDIVNSGWFTSTPMIIFLNKSDLFEDKIVKRDMNVCFPDYTGGCDSAAALKFLIAKFQEQFDDSEHKHYVHITCATNTANISFMYGSVKDIVSQNDAPAFDKKNLM